MQTEMRLYGRVTNAPWVADLARADWEEMDEDERQGFARMAPATCISVGIDPSPYLVGTDIDLEAVMEYVTKELERRRAKSEPGL
jgi:hypothetical protein